MAAFALATPALASLVTYTYDGPELTCFNGDDCGHAPTFTGANFSVDDTAPGFSGGNLIFSLSLFGDGSGLQRARESIFHKDTGTTSRRDIFCEDDCPIAYARPTFFVGNSSWDIPLPHDGEGFLSTGDVVDSGDYKTVMLDFAGGELINWQISATYQAFHTFLISSVPDQCGRGGPAGQYDCVADEFTSVSSEPGTWTRNPPVAPIPLPAGGFILLSAAASLFALRWKQAGAR
jgi:hypothetical protein